MLRGLGAAVACSVAHPSSRDALTVSDRHGRGSTHAMALPGPGDAASTHAGTSSQELARAVSAEADAAALAQHPQAHAGAHSAQSGAAHAPAVREQPAQAGLRQGGALRFPSAAGEHAASASRWAAFQSCGRRTQALGSGVQQANAAQSEPMECAIRAYSALDRLSGPRPGGMRAAPLGSTRWGGVARHAQACADAAFTTAVD